MKITIINGPNLNLTGIRETSVYGNEFFEHFSERISALYHIIEFTFLQSNVEGEIVNMIQMAASSSDAIILNPGAFTHTSAAMGDAVSSIQIPVVEVHISNIHARESFRRKSFVSGKCLGTISGFGLDSYRLAVEAIIQSAVK
jgi:3-dehydroquinate dehydratase II